MRLPNQITSFHWWNGFAIGFLLSTLIFLGALVRGGAFEVKAKPVPVEPTPQVENTPPIEQRALSIVAR